MSRPLITIYTDGGCQPNPGPGGWGAVLLGPADSIRELSGAAPETTNNRMELTAALEALAALPEPSRVDLVTDSTYLKNGITSWIQAWRRRGWVTASKDPVKNRDLWMALDEAVGRHEIRWKWVRGHTGDRWNERAHELAAAHLPGAGEVELPLGDREAIHGFLGVAWSGKAKRGAWGVVLCHEDHQRELAGVVPGRSANAAHIASAVHALEALKSRRRTHLYTVSDYLSDGATKWIHGWRRRRWQTREGKPVANRTWWEKLDALQNRQPLEWHVLGGDDLPPELERAREIAREALSAGVDS